MPGKFAVPLAAAIAALSLGACVSPNASGPRLAAADVGPVAVAAAAPPAAGKWTMPWQLDPASAASEAQGERTFTSEVPGIGRVKGTAPAIKYASYPLSSIPVRPGPNRTLDACRDTVAKEASQHGAEKVEAISYGPDRRTREGYEGPVAFRIFYKKPDGVEIRQSVLTCKVDRAMRIKDAYVPQNRPERLAAAGGGTYAALNR